MILYHRFCERLEGLPETSLARAVSIDPKTLRRWRGLGGDLADRPSRPRRSLHALSLFDFVSVWGAFRSYDGAIGGRVIESLTGVPHATADRLTSPWRTPKPEPCVEPRTTVTFLKPGVMYSTDSGRFKTAYGASVEASDVMDEMSYCRLDLLVMPAIDGSAVRRQMERVFEEYPPPLVLKADHGAAFFHNRGLRAFLASWGVLALPAPCHYPQFNEKKEHGIGEFRAHLERTPGWPFLTKQELFDALGRVLGRLNGHFPRPILGGETSAKVFATAPRSTIDRQELKEEVQAWGKRIREVYPNLRGGEPTYERRAIMCALINRRLLSINGPKLSPFFETLLGKKP